MLRVKCSRCGHVRDVPGWSASQATCPGCGKHLETEIRSAAMTLEFVLAEIVQRFGADILRDGPRTIAMFSDLAPQLRKEKILLSYLIQGNGNIQLLEAHRLDAAGQRASYMKVVQYLTEEQFVAQSAAENVCLSFLNALGTRLDVTTSETPVTFSPPGGNTQAPEKTTIRTYSDFMRILEKRFSENGNKMLSHEQMQSFLNEHDLVSRFGLQEDEVQAALNAIAARQKAGQNLVDVLSRRPV